ncbi:MULTISPECIES: hypothetical protein [Flavobacteriaceae]|uniref:hypothetical protein n=1 Tax=Flavobacteriaceae TaxID=49546 RepID=UPI0014913CFB|nr:MULTISPECIES: hypothetical protein [Allomuricauda]MDC6366542.1 hypothetical protein [Muricauda sp. AC10]
MRTLKFIFDFYLDASIHVALAVVALTCATCYLLNIPWDFLLLGFIFFSTIVCYNFIKYGVEAHKYIIVSNTYHKSIQLFSFLSFGAAVCCLVNLDKQVWMATALLGLLSTFYAVPLLPHAKNLRSLAGFKVYVVALVWTGFTVLLPVLSESLKLEWDVWLLMFQRFVLVLILMLPFEIRDLQWDDKHLKTLPQVLGIRQTKRLGLLLVLLFFVLTFLKDEIHQSEIIMRLVLGVVLVLALFLHRNEKSKYFASFWVEGIPIVWLGLFWLELKVF